MLLTPSPSTPRIARPVLHDACRYATQIYINFRLKSVAHLPWRALVYKTLNTFVDDLFSFVIKVRSQSTRREQPVGSVVSRRARSDDPNATRSSPPPADACHASHCVPAVRAPRSSVVSAHNSHCALPEGEPSPPRPRPHFA